MRKILLTLLLASAAATPALARPNDDDNDRQAAREERQAQRAERQAERQVQAERPRFDVQRQFNGGGNGQAVVQQQRMQLATDQAEAPREGRRMRMGNGAQDNGGNWQQRRQQVLQGQVQPDETLRHSDRPLPNVLRTRTRTQVMTGVPPQGSQPPMRVDNHRRDRVRWDTNWRNDHRYDWRRWRHHHRSSFRLGIYYDPFGWGYQPFSIGYRLWPNYYSSNYWINDPWQYRLPYAPPGTRWIRYYDDALLVDTWTGEVVDVIRNFFW